MINTPESWERVFSEERKKPYFRALEESVSAAYASGSVFPAEDRLFRALELCPEERVRVVILGQDPYHEPGQADGLAFSVPDGIPLPPSLRNIYREREADLGIPPAVSGDLSRWAEQGVLLLNTVLSVESGKANSHASYGWQTLTDAIIRACGKKQTPVAFLLWGAQARKKQTLIEHCGPRLVLCSAHPSPLSSYRGFFGSRPFSKINGFLRENGISEIRWE